MTEATYRASSSPVSGELHSRGGHFGGRLARSSVLPTAALLLGILLPLLISLSGSQYRLAVNIAIFGVLAMGLTIVWGFCGQPSFGQAGVYGVGAYAVAVLTVKAGFDVWIAMLLAPLFGLLAGLVMGLPAIRVRASYLALVTFAAAEALRVLEQRSDLTGGSSGLPGVPPLTIGDTTLITPEDLYYPALAMLVLVYVAVRLLRGSASGRAMLAVRGDEFAARSLGVRPGPQKLLAFALGGALSGLAGGFYACFAGFVSSVSFDVITSFQVVVMVILGGLGSIGGAIVGAAVVMVIDLELQDDPDVRLFVTGLMMITVVFVRSGVLGVARTKVETAWRRRAGGRQ